VMVHHAQGCKTCRNCRGGWPQMCDNGVEDIYGITTHGSHSDYFRATAANIVKLPDELSFVTGAALACGTGTAYGALRRLEATGRDTIAIVGQGPVGLSATMIAAAMGLRVIALDISPDRLSRAKDFGAAFVINPAQEDAPAVIKDLTHDLGTELALDTSGSPPGRLLFCGGRWKCSRATMSGCRQMRLSASYPLQSSRWSKSPVLLLFNVKL